MKAIRNLTMCILVMTLGACGGGGSSDSGIVIEGTLTEAGGAGHDQALNLRHSAGQRIGEVEICALGECSTTDDEGQWVIVADKSFAGGNVLFTLKGHGINTTTTLNIPAGIHEMFIDFQYIEGGHIEADHITIDGEDSHHES